MCLSVLLSIPTVCCMLYVVCCVPACCGVCCIQFVVCFVPVCCVQYVVCCVHVLYATLFRSLFGGGGAHSHRMPIPPSGNTYPITNIIDTETTLLCVRVCAVCCGPKHTYSAQTFAQMIAHTRMLPSALLATIRTTARSRSNAILHKSAHSRS